MYCVLSKVDGGCKCEVCGRTLPLPDCDNAIIICDPAVATPGQTRPMLLGDRIAATLDGIGITKEKWGEFVNKHGLPPGCGGCDQRQEALNNADQYAREIVAKFGTAAMDAISNFWAPVSWLRKPKSPPDQSGTSPAP